METDHNPLSRYPKVILQQNDIPKDSKFKVISVYNQDIKMFTHVNKSLACNVVLLSKVTHIKLASGQPFLSFNHSGDILLIIEKNEVEAKYLIDNLHDPYELKTLDFMSYFERTLTWQNQKIRGFIYYKTAFHFKNPEPVFHFQSKFPPNLSSSVVMLYWNGCEESLYIKTNIGQLTNDDAKSILTRIASHESFCNECTKVLKEAKHKGAFARYQLFDDKKDIPKIIEMDKCCFLSADIEAIIFAIINGLENGNINKNNL